MVMYITGELHIVAGNESDSLTGKWVMMQKRE